MTRKQFIQSHGATCDNWNWSWSFINKKKKFIIFGAWDKFTGDHRAKIFTEEWEYLRGNKSAGYGQSLEHIRLIEKEGYSLYTFPMVRTNKSDNSPTSKIKSFTPELSKKRLKKVGDSWYAIDLGYESGAKTGLYLNGVYEGVLDHVLDSQDGGNETNYIQPYKGQKIRLLREKAPTKRSPITLFMSITTDLGKIAYVADIVGWKDKRDLKQAEKKRILKHLKDYQPKEVDLLLGQGNIGSGSVNLLYIQNLRKLDSHYPTSLLRKVSDGQPLKKRTRAGGWSEVYDEGDIFSLPTALEKFLEEELQEEVSKAGKLSDTKLKARLKKAKAVPEKIQVVSVGFKRNPNVIVAVLRRAKGYCEKCGKKAPFNRRSDGSPFLEVHHWTPLSLGGEDTVGNAAALCPNCHRKEHHG
jgi:5-methylcytosine-specific restriction protein A